MIWQRAIAEYLATKDITDAFYWTLNPNSNDTGGLLAEDWKTPVDAKLQLINVACPAPSSFLGGKPSTPATPPVNLPWTSVLGGGDSKPSPPFPVPPIPQPDPASITTTASVTNSWKEAGVEHQQYDVVVKNTTKAAAGAKLRVKVAAAKVVKIWNVEDVGGGAYKLPGWLLDNGGLQAGASFTFGCITSTKAPKFSTSLLA